MSAHFTLSARSWVNPDLHAQRDLDLQAHLDLDPLISLPAEQLPQRPVIDLVGLHTSAGILVIELPADDLLQLQLSPFNFSINRPEETQLGPHGPAGDADNVLGSV